MPALRNKKTATSIVCAVLLVNIYRKLIKLVCPSRALCHIPAVSYFQFMKSMLQGESASSHSARLAMPLISDPESNGLFLRPSFLGWEVCATKPETAKQIFLRADLFPKVDSFPGTDGTLVTRFARGPNIVFLNGTEWKNQRKVINPAFHRSMPVKLFGKLTRKLFKVIDSFDFNAIDEPENEWVRVFKSIKQGINVPIWLFFPKLEQIFLWMFPKRLKVHNDLTRFLEMIDGVIDKKRATIENSRHDKSIQTNEKDLLTLMLESEDGKDKLSNKELKSNICVFFVAGHDTTANALSFSIYYLAKKQDIQQRAREEATKILGEDKEDILPFVDQTKEMVYINMIIKETLRINSPALAILTRQAMEDTYLGGTFIPKHTFVMVNINDLHHHPAVWSNPEEFNPERFSKGGEAEELGKDGMSWIPFGNGTRQCIGLNFSLAEQRVMLSMLLRKYTWSLPEDSIHKDKLETTNIGIATAVNLGIVFKRIY
ncbi:cytochrome P450 [Phycomyces nitens]|nr:cytochrome P450 [Phycomyces nitens]